MQVRSTSSAKRVFLFFILSLSLIHALPANTFAEKPSCSTCGQQGGGQGGGGGGGGGEMAGMAMMALGMAVSAIAPAMAQIEVAKEEGRTDRYNTDKTVEGQLRTAQMMQEGNERQRQATMQMHQDNLSQTKELTERGEVYATERVKMQLDAQEKDRVRDAEERKEIRTLEQAQANFAIAAAQEQARQEILLTQQAVNAQLTQAGLQNGMGRRSGLMVNGRAGLMTGAVVQGGVGLPAGGNGSLTPTNNMKVSNGNLINNNGTVIPTQNAVVGIANTQTPPQRGIASVPATSASQVVRRFSAKESSDSRLLSAVRNQAQDLMPRYSFHDSSRRPVSYRSFSGTNNYARALVSGSTRGFRIVASAPTFMASDLQRFTQAVRETRPAASVPHVPSARALGTRSGHRSR